MLSEEGQRIRLWLLQNVKNAPSAPTIQAARAARSYGKPKALAG
jgi:hypothetical protein